MTADSPDTSQRRATAQKRRDFHTKPTKAQRKAKGKAVSTANEHEYARMGKFHAKTVGRGNRKSLTTEITEDTEVTANRREWKGRISRPFAALTQVAKTPRKSSNERLLKNEEIFTQSPQRRKERQREKQFPPRMNTNKREWGRKPSRQVSRQAAKSPRKSSDERLLKNEEIFTQSPQRRKERQREKQFPPRMNTNMHEWGNFTQRLWGGETGRALTTEITEETEVTANKRE
ncbi:hypothetical protein Selin_0673 [Desulfurispirillum indicum S5]|uniref:Uncharacterized protein n=2 Tax=Desulfurispirillum TaxID=393029 RepID=E6W1G2_DESIS|nr:hypothetical protein Selin_0673 [Desulfurispirillum indicum S5]